MGRQQPEGLVGGTVFAMAVAPADGAAVAAEETGGGHRILSDPGHRLGVGGDIEGVVGAMGFAQEAGLAIGLPGDGGRGPLGLRISRMYSGPCTDTRRSHPSASRGKG